MKHNHLPYRAETTGNLSDGDMRDLDYELGRIVTEIGSGAVGFALSELESDGTSQAPRLNRLEEAANSPELG